MDRDPIAQFRRWLNEAIAAAIPEPNAMTLATATREGIPSARIVLLEAISERGLVFFTNYLSRKGRDLAENPQATLVFYWHELERQVRIEGAVRKTDSTTSDAYFATRPPASRVGSAASSQSETVASRTVLEQRMAELWQQYPEGNVPRPAHWGGYELTPTRLEFWQGRPSRLHDRIEYVVDGGAWMIRRLAP